MFKTLANKIEDNLRRKTSKEIEDYLDEKHKTSESYTQIHQELLYYFEDLQLRQDLLQNKTALDIGSNEHFFDEYCKERYSTNFVALDNEQSQLGDKHPLGVVSDARVLPFKNEAFDLVISHDSMPHTFVPYDDENGNRIIIEGDIENESLENILSLFRESYRVTKKNGQIRMSTLSEKRLIKEMESNKQNNSHDFSSQEHFDQQFSRIRLIKKALSMFEAESGARCILKDGNRKGLIIIMK